MKKINILLSFIFLLNYNSFSQNNKTILCDTNGKLLFAESLPRGGNIYFFEDVKSGKRDTIFTTYLGSKVEKCHCLDTIITCLEDRNSPIIFSLKYFNGRWTPSNPVVLPPKFPLIGSVIEGKQYEEYSNYMLVSINEVIADLTILSVNNQTGNLIPIESFIVNFRINLEAKNLTFAKSLIKK